MQEHHNGLTLLGNTHICKKMMTVEAIIFIFDTFLKNQTATCARIVS